MSTASEQPIYYDPFDTEIDNDPHPVWRRMRDEAPLYYNEKHDFFALSRFDDVEQALVDWDTYRSGNGSTLEIIKADIELPSGIILMEDPPIHDAHRGLLSRVFTPKKMNALEPEVRAFCARSLDPLVGTGGFDFIADLGAQMPMRTIGMLLGIPEQDQEAIRDRLDAGMRIEEGAEYVPPTGEAMGDFEVFAEYIDWRAEHPSDDLMTELLQRRVRRRRRGSPPPDPRRGPHLRRCCSPAPATRPPPGSSAGPASSWPSTPTSGASSSRTAA